MHTELEIALSGCGLVGGHFLNVFVTPNDATIRLLTAKYVSSTSNLIGNNRKGTLQRLLQPFFCNTRTFSPAIASYVTRLYRYTNTPCFRKLTGSNAF